MLLRRPKAARRSTLPCATRTRLPAWPRALAGGGTLHTDGQLAGIRLIRRVHQVKDICCRLQPLLACGQRPLRLRLRQLGEQSLNQRVGTIRTFAENRLARLRGCCRQGNRLAIKLPAIPLPAVRFYDALQPLLCANVGFVSLIGAIQLAGEAPLRISVVTSFRLRSSCRSGLRSLLRSRLRSRRFRSSYGLRAELSGSGGVLKDGMTGRSLPKSAIVHQLCRNTTSASMALLGDGSAAPRTSMGLASQR